MSSLFDIVIGGTAAKDFDADVVELEVEENADLPGAFSITLPVALTSTGDYDTVSDIRLAPLSNIAVTAQAADGQTHCLIDGYVLAQSVHLDTGTAKSTLKVWGQDASWLMNATEKTREWVDVTDGAAANTIFGEYGFTADPGNSDDDLPAHTSDGASLMQRASDAQFLRALARRSGKLFRIFCTDTPGERTGFFAKPDIAGDPAVTLTLNDAAAATVSALDISWDVMRPSAVTARQALFTDKDSEGAGGTVTDNGLPPMDQRGLADFATGPVTALLTTTAADAGTLTQRADSLLREAGWFVRCQGSTDVSRLGAILRVGTVAKVDAAGALHSGNYLVWSVRHHITAEKHEMAFVLVRNAVGAQPDAAPGGEGGVMNEALLQDLLDSVKHRFFGKYRGVVTDVDAATMRIKASVPSVLPGMPTGWCMPCVPYAGPQVGFLMLPEVGSGVWIEFEGGDVSFPIWVGCYWSSGDVPSAAAADVKSIITNAGTLSFDNGGSSVTLQDSSQDSLVFDSSGATVKAGSGKIEVGASGVSVNSGALEVS